jgi:hypothetical protein
MITKYIVSLVFAFVTVSVLCSEEAAKDGKTLEWVSTMLEDKEPVRKQNFNFASFDVGAKVMAYNSEAKVSF